MARFIGCCNKDRVVPTVKVLKDMAKDIPNIVVNHINYFGRTFVTTPEALDYPAERSKSLPIGTNLQVCEGVFR